MRNYVYIRMYFCYRFTRLQKFINCTHVFVYVYRPAHMKTVLFKFRRAINHVFSFVVALWAVSKSIFLFKGAVRKSEFF